MGCTFDKIGVAAALLATFSTVSGQNGSTSTGPVWSHEDFTTSPPVYPSPNITGLVWEDAFERAKAWVAQLTLDEKAHLVTGTEGPCVGNIAPIPRLNFTGLCLQDGPLAIRQASYASVFPAGLTVAAAWDRKLAYTRGLQIGEEYKGKGSHVVLGPVAGPLGRSGYAGRNWEGFSPDPYLTGVFMEETIWGHQDAGVQACSKQQETQRNPTTSPNNQTIEAISANIDDRTLHELYLWPFANAVHSGTASIMCSYNRLNASYGCQNSKLLNGVLKEELGFQGWVVSDWMATHAGYHAAEAGLDMNMPGGIQFSQSVPSLWGANLTISVNNGSLAESRLDDAVLRIITPYFWLGQDKDFPAIDGDTPGTQRTWNTNTYRYNFTYGPSSVDVRDNHHELIREIGAAGTVLLKNTNNTLPLKSPRNIGVFGNDAADLIDGLYFATLTKELGFEQGILPVAGGSGTGRLTYVVTPLEAIKAKVGNDALVQYVTNNTYITEDQGWSIIYPTPPDVCIVFLNTWASEAYDRTTLLVDWNGTAVVEKVAANCPNTVVVTHSSGLNVLPFADHPNVTAILAAHLSGQEVGNSIVDILWGDVNPSGKLPYTITHEEHDYAFADIVNSTELLETEDPNAWQQDFTERLLIDYRHFDHFNLSVQYEFGFGLSYTTFSLGEVIVETLAENIAAEPEDLDILPGGNPALWDKLYKITTSVTNTGSVAGATVPQLYLGLPQIPNEATTPVKALRGFDKVFLELGETKEVTFELARRDISYWNTFTQQWTIAPGAVTAHVGFSSRDIQATTTFTPIAAAAGYRPRRV
ncbi:glycoside hydrolase family 3 protein [Zasmidium cellare ATCC 36951]|uniref:Probable beta-glucosidase G n=1 Tax=Zasmidium cellare ATCC 36951 TaxID=1080233 RepID=A0A6A6C8E3_ZASCE|nr:glycoside hydrolase family 3 protein [Zasmidium cellare ATCC 36951]KAF2163305.1 glycoside hydrolase family 3 protein [Zasmidium cellare ATCC 36951]